MRRHDGDGDDVMIIMNTMMIVDIRSDEDDDELKDIVSYDNDERHCDFDVTDAEILNSFDAEMREFMKEDDDSFMNSRISASIEFNASAISKSQCLSSSS